MMSVTIVVLLSILMSVMALSPPDTCSDNRGYPGIPGIPGNPGTSGNDGEKGAKGDPGENGQLLKGQKGEPGPPGAPGRAGLPGDPGMPGFPGLEGPKGTKGSPNVPFKKNSFSFKKTNRNVRKNQAIKFDGAIVAEENLDNGVFVCKVNGVYYFTYHVTCQSKICLNIKKGNENIVSFCDSIEKGFLVTSGSVVQQLMVGDKVSIQSPADSSGMTAAEGADSIFTGFLLFPV